jgi:hypothetical protein
MRFVLFFIFLFSTPVLAQERAWQLDVADEDVYLVFGVPDTDDVGLSLWCKINSDVVRIYVPEGSSKLKPDQSTQIKLSVKNTDYEVMGKTSENRSSGRTSVEVEMRPTDPAILALLTADHFTMTIADHLTVTPLIEADVAGLLKLCGQAPAQ